MVATAEVAGSVPAERPLVDSKWRVVCARASVILGAAGLVSLVLVVASSLTFWLDFLPGLDAAWIMAPGTIVGVVSGFLGRRSRQRRAAVVGSLLSGLAFLGFTVAAFILPYEPGIEGLAWTPDSTRVTYAHTWAAADGADGIWVVSADGSSEPTRLRAGGTSPDWSPDGTRIAYLSDPGGDLWLMAGDGSNPRKLTAAEQHEVAWASFGPAASWSPDGTQIVFAGAPLGDGTEGIWIIDADGRNLRQITPGGDAPDWSPDGTRIVYLRQLHGPNEPRGQQAGYWVMDVDGTGPIQLPGDYTGAPRWTADGRITVDCPEGMCVMDSDGSNRQVLLADASGGVLSPDGTRVAHVTGVGGKSDIVVTTLDGSTEIILVQ